MKTNLLLFTILFILSNCTQLTKLCAESYGVIYQLEGETFYFCFAGESSIFGHPVINQNSLLNPTGPSLSILVNTNQLWRQGNNAILLQEHFESEQCCVLLMDGIKDNTLVFVFDLIARSGVIYGSDPPDKEFIFVTLGIDISDLPNGYHWAILTIYSTSGEPYRMYFAFVNESL
jgi:hypothetical protein